MPILQLTTKAAKQVWASPDGQRKIFELEMDYQGKPVIAKTYSDAIATVGWSGTVETYEKQGRNGIETFVKQPPKEGGSFGGGRGNYKPKDEKAIQAMWAIDKAKDVVIARGFKATTPMDDILSEVEAYAQALYEMVPRVKAIDNVDQGEAPADEPANPDPVIEDIPDGPVDLSKIDKIFGTEASGDAEGELPGQVSITEALKE